MDFRGKLETAFSNVDISLSEGQVNAFVLYRNLLLDWNEKINLTAITEDEDVIEKHFIDSVLLLKKIDIPENASLIDVGTGAGFPGIPLKIMRPDLEILLLDSLQKRVMVLSDMIKKLELTTISAVHMRAEMAGKDKRFREQFDIGTARAVTRLRELSEFILPLVKVGGMFVPMKAGNMDEELKEAMPAIKTLGGEKEELIAYTLSNGDKRTLLKFKKKRVTPAKYPRSFAKMKTTPLV